MSSNTYVHHISQKYRLAMALAVLKSKPEDSSINQHINKIKDRIKDKKMDIEEISLCSDDFNIDDEVLDEFNGSNSRNETISNENNSSLIILEDFDANVYEKDMSNFVGIFRDSQADESQVFSQSEFNMANSGTNNSVIVNKDDIHCEIVGKNADSDKHNVKNDEIARKMAMNINKQLTNATRGSNVEINSVKTVGHTVAVNIDDVMKDRTIINNFTNITCNDRYSNVVTSSKLIENKENDVLKPTYIGGNCAQITTNENKNVNNIVKNNKQDNATVTNKDEDTVKRKANINSNVTEILKINEQEKSVKESKCEDNVKGPSTLVTNGNNVLRIYLPQDIELNTNTQYTEANNINIVDTQDTIIYTFCDTQHDSQDYTHVSQSQYENVEISNALLYGNRLNRLEVSDDKSGMNQNTVKNYSVYEVTDRITETDCIRINKDGFSNSPHYTTISTSKENETYNTINLTNEEINITKTQCYTKSNKQEYNYNETQNFEGIEIEDENDNMLDENLKENEEVTSQNELIPFKIIEELNRVKSYINRKTGRKEDGNWTDSGYRSDSQSKSSVKSAQQTDSNWVNQSAHSLYLYLTHCPLVAANEDITKEVSQTIGRVIDYLHEEEQYPSFLEEILEYIDCLISQVLVDSCSENLLKKEEEIQRIYLLNQSVHILKYTIDKISKHLSGAHENLCNNEDLYEIRKIEEVENFSYIFHLLETLIPKYVKLKANENQSQSQEDKSLKRSSLTEIWKKKWSSAKEIVNFEDGNEVCVLTKCGEVLNKIVVDCIEGYSLISFAALQCLNMLQK